MRATPSSNITVLIVTHNRREYVSAAIESALNQTPKHEIIVWDNASTDDTTDHIKKHYPSVTLHESSDNISVLTARNRLVEMSTTPYVYFLDDDAYFDDPDTLQNTLAYFAHPRIGIVGLPMIEHNQFIQGSDELMATSKLESLRFRNFCLESACLARRDIWLYLGGYRESLGFYTEASDLSIRMIQLGFVIAFAAVTPLIHNPPPKPKTGFASHATRAHTHTANNILFTYRYVPLLRIPIVYLGQLKVIFRRYAEFNRRRLLPVGLFNGMVNIFKHLNSRNSLPTPIYVQWCCMDQPGITFEHLDQILPPLPSVPDSPAQSQHDSPSEPQTAEFQR
ncbi:glycosyltransferase family 2 protein [Poriferisphaera sp. WC338]|uniref:glycosyltransferase family 2 protein n=1 Tax=Poriferisphaera sp. WC338 TaxID=3425129 RepID=UPI003D813FAF